MSDLDHEKEHSLDDNKQRETPWPQSRSLRSWRSGRSRTQSGTRPASLNRIYSAGFHDDHGVYLDPEDFPTDDGDAQDHCRPDQSQTDQDSKDDVGREKDDEPLEEVESQDFEQRPADGKADRAGENGELEKRRSSSRHSTRKSVRSQKSRDPNVVSWNGPDDPESPKNWPQKRKWLAVIVVSSFVCSSTWTTNHVLLLTSASQTFISPVASSMVAPTLPQMKADLNVDSDVLSQMMLSIFILAYAFGPLLFGPLSEVYGRIPVLQLANLFFLIFNLVCGFAQSGTQMLVFRLLAGLGGSAPLSTLP